jgi:prepilin-type processing-associated H-X9-DG protein
MFKSGTYYNPSTGAGEVPMYSWVVPILPYIDNQELFNQWSMFGSIGGTPACVPYFDGDPASTMVAQIPASGQASNYKIGNTAIGVLRCPDDLSAQPNQGNLSYVVNGGFSLWHAESYGWAGLQNDGNGTPQWVPMTWLSGGSTTTTYPANMGICQKLGVFFLEESTPQGGPRVPWNVRSTLNSMQDGASSTLMVSENTLVGASTGGFTVSGTKETNWSTPYPTFTMFIGATNVCSGATALAAGTGVDCSTGILQSNNDVDATNWAYANKVGTYANINYGQNLTNEGYFPFSTSGHPGGCNMMFCDGAVRFISQTLDGTVYSKIITPAGSRLPVYERQLPVNQDSFAQ